MSHYNSTVQAKGAVLRERHYDLRSQDNALPELHFHTFSRMKLKHAPRDVQSVNEKVHGN